MNPEALHARLRAILVEQFEIAPERITPEARLYEDLGLDSIDAVDLVIHVQELTGRKIRPQEFREVRTVSDVERTIESLLGTTNEA
ncbi:MAG TPA: acyl carrier protein [Gammaproteobacteria bacterium]|nr:acyl carrier protein [Gammaproteobacteria bacterium]